MKLKDAIKELRAGHRIKRIEWKDAAFLTSIPAQTDIDINIPERIVLVQKIKDLFRYDNSLLLSDEWIVVGEDQEVFLTFGDAVEELKKFKKLKLIDWDKFIFIQLDENPPHEIIFNNLRTIEDYALSHLDIFAEDWVILE